MHVQAERRARKGEDGQDGRQRDEGALARLVRLVLFPDADYIGVRARRVRAARVTNRGLRRRAPP